MVLHLVWNQKWEEFHRHVSYQDFFWSHTVLQKMFPFQLQCRTVISSAQLVESMGGTHPLLFWLLCEWPRQLQQPIFWALLRLSQPSALDSSSLGILSQQRILVQWGVHRLVQNLILDWNLILGLQPILAFQLILSMDLVWALQFRNVPSFPSCD